MKSPQSAIRNPQSSLTPLDYAYRLLARRAYSEVARTVDRLKTQGYLDDARLAADQTERLRSRGFGSEGIRAKLTQKGLSSDSIGQTLETSGENQDLQSAQRFLASRFSADALKEPQIHARAFRLLLRRGYSQEIVESLLGSAPEDG